MKTVSFSTSLFVHLAAAAVVLWFDAPGWLELIPPQSGLASIELVATMAQSPSPAPRKVDVEVSLPSPDVSPPRRDVAVVTSDRDEQVPLFAFAVEVLAPPRATESDQPNHETGGPELPRKQERPEEAADAPRAASAPSPPSTKSQGAQAEIPPRPQFNPEPIYPPQALLRRITGRVVLRVRVGSNGRVDAASVYKSSGHDSLDKAALEAVQRWRFLPARQLGAPVAQEIAVPIRFSIGR